MTSHGKGENDGVGSDVKNYDWRKTLQKKAVVTNAQEFADLAKKKFPDFGITLCLSDDIHAETKFLKDRYEKHSKPIPKTHSVHHLDFVEKKLVSNLKSFPCKCHPVCDSSANSGKVEGGSVVHIEEEIKQGDYVKIVHGNCLHMFAVVTEETVGNKFVIQYFQKKENWWVLHPNDYDAREAKDLKEVETTFDRREHAFFKE